MTRGDNTHACHREITARASQHEGSFYIFNSFFLKKLAERDNRGRVGGHSNVKKWTKVGTSTSVVAASASNNCG
jgi:Ulp1 family protease